VRQQETEEIMADSKDTPDPGDRSEGADPRARVPLTGSKRQAARDIAATGAPVDADSVIEVTVMLRRQEAIPDEQLSRPMERKDFAARHGASAADLDLVTRTLTGLGARVISADAASRRVRIAGTAGFSGRSLAPPWIRSAAGRLTGRWSPTATARVP
jgi:kumamolisin